MADLKLDLLNNFNEALRAYAREKNIAFDAFDDLTDRDTVTALTKAGQIYQDVVNFLEDNQLYSGRVNKIFSLDKSDIEAMLPSFESVKSGLVSNFDAIMSLVSKHTPENQVASIAKQVAAALYEYSNKSISRTHFAGIEGKAVNNLTPLSSVYPSGALSTVDMASGMPSMEAFGASIDTVVPDLRMAITVVLLKPHKGITSRMIHRRTLTGAVIQYVIHQDEAYNLVSSQDNASAVRNSFNHRSNILNLYRNPESVDMTLTPIVPLLANDEDSALVEDGVIKFGKHINLFDLSMIPGKVGFDRANYTDLVSEGVMLDKLFVDINGEKYAFELSTHTRSRLLPALAQESYSGERETKMTFRVAMDKNSEQRDGTPTTVFADVEGDQEYVKVVVELAAFIDLMTADAHGMADGYLEAASARKGVEASDTLKNLVDGLTLTLEGFSFDAKFSEENLRKVDRACRSLTYMISYEQPQGKTIIVDFAMGQTMPEHVLNVAQEVQAIGIDHRNLQLFIKTMNDVHNRNIAEEKDERYMENYKGNTVARSFVSGQRVNPYIFFGTIDLNAVVNVRTSDLFGDLRQYMDSYLTKMFSVMHWKSLYIQQLDNGEVPRYKVLTSTPIIENLLSIPHIHQHMMADGMKAEGMYADKVPGEPIEYTRKLPSGVILECISSSFHYLKDKMIIVPFRAGEPSSELNFAHEWDQGQFVANYTPTDGYNQVNRRVFMNTREFPIITNGLGAILNILNLEEKLPDITKA